MLRDDSTVLLLARCATAGCEQDRDSEDGP